MYANIYSKSILLTDSDVVRNTVYREQMVMMRTMTETYCKVDLATLPN